MRVITIVVLSFLVFAINCDAQPEHKIGKEAEIFYSQAVGVYARYPTNQDSIASAIILLNKAIEIDSNYYDAWTHKLGFQCQAKWFEFAITTTADILHIFPHETNVMFFRGVLQFKLKRDVAAIATFRKLLDTYDTIPESNVTSEELKTMQINKALAIKLLGGVDDANKMLATLVAGEKDNTVKNYIRSYISASPEKIINDMAP